MIQTFNDYRLGRKKYKEFKAEFDEINSSFTNYNLHQKEIYNDLDNSRLSCLYDELRDLAKDMLRHLEQNNKEKTTMNIAEQDQDILLTNQFSEAIDNLIEEILPLIDEKNLYYIINLKLKRIFELYKDTVLYGCSYDGLRENAISKIRVIKREEDKKKEYPVLTEFNKALENIKRDSITYSMSELLDRLNTLYCLYGSVLNLSLDDVKKKYFELSNK